MRIFCTAMIIALAVEMYLILPRHTPEVPQILQPEVKVEEKVSPPVEKPAPIVEKPQFQVKKGVVLKGTKIYELKNGVPVVTLRVILANLKCNVLGESGDCNLIEITQEGFQRDIIFVEKTGVFVPS